MTDSIAFQTLCPVSRTMVTSVSTRREVRQLVERGLAIEVFCTRCAQLHRLDAAERQRLAQRLRSAD